MASAKIVWSKPNRTGIISVSIRIIHARVQYPKLICKVPSDHWDPKRSQVRSKNPDFVRYNQQIHDALSSAKDYILDCQTKGKEVQPKAFLFPERAGDDIISHILARKSGELSFRTSLKYRTVTNRISEAGLNTIISDINPKWVKSLDTYLRSKGNNDGTRAKYLSVVKSVCSDAFDAGLISSNPFREWHKTSTPSKKVKLTMEEFGRIKSVPLDGRLAQVRDIFVFATLARGMRAFDIITLEWTSVHDDHLSYVADKGSRRKDGRIHHIGLIDIMPDIIASLPRVNDYVFGLPEIPKSVLFKDEKRYKKHIDSILASINLDLKQIGKATGIPKNISMHVARHTYAFLADQAQVPLGTIQQLLGHANILTTRIYVESIQKSEELDKAAAKVFK